MGIITFNSNCPACPAIITVRSLPITWNMAIFNISARTGLTFPGMIDEPGWTTGNLISASPVLGPDESRRMSLAIRVRSCASVRNAPLKWTGSAILCIDSNRLSDWCRVNPVRRLRV